MNINLPIMIDPVDISKGKKLDCWACPTVHAVKRAWAQAGRTPLRYIRTLRSSTTLIARDGTGYIAQHPASLTSWINRFDFSNDAPDPIAVLLVFYEANRSTIRETMDEVVAAG